MVAQTGQPYAYTGDDPVNGVDPLGLWWGQGTLGKVWDDTGGKVVHGVSAGLNDAANLFPVFGGKGENDSGLFIDWILGSDTNQTFTQCDQLTQKLMTDPHQAEVMAQVSSYLDEGKLQGTLNYSDPTSPSSFIRDLEGFFTDGGSGSNDADAFLGSYEERWDATAIGNNEANVNFTVTNTTDLNSLVHPGFWITHAEESLGLPTTSNENISIDGLAPYLIPGDQNAFSPQKQTLTWQETVTY
jgi:hypothetical protein